MTLKKKKTYKRKSSFSSSSTTKLNLNEEKQKQIKLNYNKKEQETYTTISNQTIEYKEITVKCAFEKIDNFLYQHLNRNNIAVIGALAWFTHFPLLEFLSSKQIPCNLLVQKELFLNPKKVSTEKEHFCEQLREAYSKLNYWNTEKEKEEERKGENITEAVRCIGIINKKKDNPVFMHHKFLILLDKTTKKPFAVLNGSCNLSQNSVHNLENMIYIQNEEVAIQFYNEWKAISLLAEPLDWTSRNNLSNFK